MISYLKLAAFLFLLVDVVLPHLVPVLVNVVGSHPQGMGWGVANRWPCGSQSLITKKEFIAAVNIIRFK